WLEDLVSKQDKAIDLEALRKRIAEEFKASENAQIRIGIIGDSGTGKSSLINAIAGKYVAETGATETTNEPQEITLENGQVTFVDLPGCGTRKWPLKNYVHRLSLESYDAFLLVNNG